MPFVGYNRFSPCGPEKCCGGGPPDLYCIRWGEPTLWAHNGAEWTILPNLVNNEPQGVLMWQVEFEDSAEPECGGVNNGPQDALWIGTFDCDQEIELTLAAIGAVERHNPGYDRLLVYVDAWEQIRGQSDKQEGGCGMEVKQINKNLVLPVGFHTIMISAETVDGEWHKNAYWRLTLGWQCPEDE